MAPTTYTKTPEGDIDIEFDNAYISKAQYLQAIGSISATLASASGAWDGEAPDWFPEPPEWLRLAEQALEDTEPDYIDLLGSSDAMEWAEAFVDAVHKNPLIAFDPGTVVGWFSNAMWRGEADEQERERERREHPLIALDFESPEVRAAFENAVKSVLDLGD